MPVPWGGVCPADAGLLRPCPHRHPQPDQRPPCCWAGTGCLEAGGASGGAVSGRAFEMGCQAAVITGVETGEAASAPGILPGMASEGLADAVPSGRPISRHRGSFCLGAAGDLAAPGKGSAGRGSADGSGLCLPVCGRSTPTRQAHPLSAACCWRRYSPFCGRNSGKEKTSRRRISPPGKVFSKKKKFPKPLYKWGKGRYTMGIVVTVKETTVKALSDKGYSSAGRAVVSKTTCRVQVLLPAIQPCSSSWLER